MELPPSIASLLARDYDFLDRAEESKAATSSRWSSRKRSRINRCPGQKLLYAVGAV